MGIRKIKKVALPHVAIFVFIHYFLSAVFCFKNFQIKNNKVLRDLCKRFADINKPHCKI